MEVGFSSFLFLQQSAPVVSRPSRFRPAFRWSRRIRLQEGVGICYAKLKYLLEIGPLIDLPERLCLTASDIAQYREILPGKGSGRARPNFNWITDGKAS